MRIKTAGDLFFFLFFVGFAIWLVLIPAYKMSGYVPSLNKKIDRIIQEADTPTIMVVHIGFWDYNVSDIELPIIINNLIISNVSEIMSNPMIKDGYRRYSETKFCILDVHVDGKKYLTITLAWDRVREIMEVRFDDIKGNTKSRFYKISKELADKTFNLIEESVSYIDGQSNNIANK
jgi:hypothetical protein